MIWRPAEIEIDVIVALGPDGEGGWRGELAAPTANVEGHILSEVSVDGPTISFEHTDRPARGVFHGKLSEDGDRLEGKFVQADGQATTFVLHRREDAGERKVDPEVAGLGGPADLRQVFNAGRGSTRLVLLLSPTCELCRIGARLTQRYVLESIGSPELRAYVVWLPMSDEDTRATVLRAAGDLPDERALHFWAADLTIAHAFADTLEIADEPAWDVFLVYGPDAAWSGEAPPKPSFYMHRGSGLPRSLQYNGFALADAVRGELGR